MTKKEIKKKEKYRNNGEEELKPRVGYTSFFYYFDPDKNQYELHEQVIKENKAQYCLYYTEDGFISYIEGTNDLHPIPTSDPAIREGAVILPEQADEYENTSKLIEEIKAHIHKYVDITPYFENIATWYILLTWVYDRINTLPYLRFLGDSGTGKSRALTVIGGLCYKPMKASGAITPAPIYRMIHKWKGTLLIDEADFKDSNEKAEVIKILNCGFEKNNPVIRCQKEKPNDLEILPTYCPKILVTRQRFEDQALESRCLTEIMFQTTRKDIPYLLPKEFYNEQMKIRNKLLMFRFRNWNKIDIDKIQNLDFGDIDNRLKQTTASFAVLFANIDGFNEFKTFIEKYDRELKEERAQTFDGQIINVIFDIIKEKRDNVTNVTDVTNVTITPKDIAEKIREKHNLDKLPDPRYIGKRLQALGLEIKVKKVEGKAKRCLIWDSKKMDILKKRYVIDDEVTSVTSNKESNIINIIERMEHYADQWQREKGSINSLNLNDFLHEFLMKYQDIDIDEAKQTAHKLFKIIE